MNIERYSGLRPNLYHLTDRSNLIHIQEANTLFCAADLMTCAGRRDLLRVRRQRHERLVAGVSVVSIRDQRPLYEGNTELSKGFSFEDFVELLNGKVFFWPGDDKGPIDYGDRHFRHYEKEAPIMLRCPFRSLLSENTRSEPLFSRYNSGSPRCSNGKRSPRGPNMFLKARDFERRPSDVVEVVFEHRVFLPTDTEFRDGVKGLWQILCNKS